MRIFNFKNDFAKLIMIRKRLLDLCLWKGIFVKLIIFNNYYLRN